jgi:hypothetical protein
MNLTPQQQTYVARARNLKLREAEISPTIEQLTRSRIRIPVLVYERERIAQYLHFIKRYRRRLVFAGRLEVLGILLVGFTGYIYLSGTKYGSTVIDGLLNILASAKLDDCLYQIVDWHQKRGQLLVFVTRKFYR